MLIVDAQIDAAAVRLDEWLHREAYAARTDRVSTRRIFEYGPKCARDSQVEVRSMRWF
jgi:hypothetical protein